MSQMDIDAMMASGRVRIDLSALWHNYRLIADRVEPGKVGAVVKADAYGLGASRIANTLLRAGCRHFFVAHLKEALNLKPHLPDDAELFVLNGLTPDSEALCADAGIIPVLNSMEQARRWTDTARLKGRHLPAVLQLDSGMSRLGVDVTEAAELAVDPIFRAHVDLRLVMSHLACADVPQHAANAAQAQRFLQIATFFPDVPHSFANSGGIFMPTGYRGEIARTGIALYGGSPHDGRPNPMKPVVALDARVIQIRTLPADTGVGYGLSFNTKRESRIATIGVGYADGLPRTLSDRGAAWFDGHRLPIAGRVSMDSITLDVTDLPAGKLKAGDWVELIGPNQTLDELARDAGTISYEILTSMGRRYHRSYVASDPLQTAANT